MPTIVKPQVLVFQEFRIIPSELTEPLRAHISGPNAMLHRYAVAAEKALIDVGAYDRLADTVYPWPHRTAGSKVDMASVRLFIDDALLLYHEDLIGNSAGGRGTVAPVAGHKNWIRSSTLSYRTNGALHLRSDLFLDRDVQVGDRVYVRGVDDAEGQCNEYELWTYVTGFAADAENPDIGTAATDSHNQTTVGSLASINQTAGPNNCVEATVDGSAYNGLPDGRVSETYTIEVIRSSVSGCNAARLRVTSSSGTDNVAELTPEDMGSPTDIGTRGLKVTWDVVPGSCSESAASAGVSDEELVVGQTWTVTVRQAFTATTITEGAIYTGANNDTYIIEVTKGGTWAELPQVSVTTVKGLDYSGPTEVTGLAVAFPVGSHGLTATFGGSTQGLRKGDKFYITVVSGVNGPVRTLILKDNLPTEIQDATDLDLRLFIKKDIEVTENRLSNPPLVNYTKETTQMVVNAGITAYDSTWTDSGTEQAMSVWSGRLYIEYREWLAALANQLNFIDDVADIDDIPGQLDEANPLKWGVYRSLQNSNGTRVGYTAVVDPDSLDSWQNVIERVDGRDDVYNFVPLTYNREVLNLFQAHVASESSPESGNWKGMFVNLLAVSTKMIVGKSTADAQLLHPTSTDGNEVLAILEDNPEATDTQYTLLTVPANNSGFITYGVQAGDIVRYLYTVDAWGTSSYLEFVVDEVLSENSLLLLTGHSSPVSVAQKIEIWHPLNKNEIITDLKEQAQSFADRRVCAVWPDIVGTAGNAQAGYFLCAALAGLASGVMPHQPLTNVEITGFDDLAARTKDFFSGTQLDQLDDGGVWICTEDRDGTPYSWHALTTNTLDLNRREEMVRRNVDSISYLFLRRLAPFIGRTNATDSMVRRLRYEVMKIIKFLKTNGYTDELGSQLIEGTIRKDKDGNEILRIHPLMADRIEIVLDLVVPYPLNNIELHLVI